MADNLTAGNPRAHRVRVYFTNSGTDTIYEGMALCYNSDSTSNWWGGSVSDGVVTAATTLAEGNQNPAKYIEVEKPANDNLLFFAGVVAPGGWCGKSDARVVDVYIPNGAIVPVRSSIANYEGETILAIAADDYEFQTPVYATNRMLPCAIAMEDTDCATDEGLCLAKLYDPNVFMPQAVGFTTTGQGTSQRLTVGVGISTGEVQPVRWLIDSYQTGGTFRIARIRGEIRGTGGNFGGGCVGINAVIGNGCTTDGHVYGATLTASIKAGASGSDDTVLSANNNLIGALIKSECLETSDITITGNAYPLWVAGGFNVTVAGTYAMMYFEDTSTIAETPDYWFESSSTTAVCLTADAGLSSSHAIKIRVGGVNYNIMCDVCD